MKLSFVSNSSVVHGGWCNALRTTHAYSIPETACPPCVDTWRNFYHVLIFSLFEMSNNSQVATAKGAWWQPNMSSVRLAVTRGEWVPIFHRCRGSRGSQGLAKICSSNTQILLRPSWLLGCHCLLSCTRIQTSTYSMARLGFANTGEWRMQSLVHSSNLLVSETRADSEFVRSSVTDSLNWSEVGCKRENIRLVDSSYYSERIM